MRTFLIAASALLSACALAPLAAAETPVQPVDLLLTSATVVDVEKGTTTPDQLVAVRGGVRPRHRPPPAALDQRPQPQVLDDLFEREIRLAFHPAASEVLRRLRPRADRAPAA